MQSLQLFYKLIGLTMSKKSLQLSTGKIYAFVLPGFILFIFSLMLPLLISLFISFTNWKGQPNMSFVGLKNYAILMKDVKFWLSFVNNLKFMGILLVTQIGLAFIFAIFIQSKSIYYREAHRRIIFLPAVLAPIVVGMIWQIVYNNDYGMIASVMRFIGFENFKVLWLDSPKMVIFSISIALTWQYVGQFTIIIMAGMQNINSSILEAAVIDGAGIIRRSVSIVLPLLKNTISVCVLMVISGVMKMFDLVFSISGGGPGRASQITALYAFDQAFKVNKLDYASAVAVVMVILSLLLIAIFRLFMSRLGGADE